MLAIAPFRHLIVYPTMLREFGREWRRRDVAHGRDVGRGRGERAVHRA